MKRTALVLLVGGLVGACSASPTTESHNHASTATGGGGGSGPSMPSGNGGGGGSAVPNTGGSSSGTGGSDVSAGGAGPMEAGIEFTEGGSDNTGFHGDIFDITTGDVPLDPGQETTVCVDRFLPTDKAIDMVHIGADLTPGGHHIIFYKSSATSENATPRQCSAVFDIGTSEFTGGILGTVPLFIAQQASTSLDFPPGVAYSFPAHQMTTIELHFLNTTTKQITVRGTVHIGVATDETITQHANLMFYGPAQSLMVPPGTSTFRQFYAFNHSTPPNIFAATTHTHQLSTGTYLGFGKQNSTTKVFESTTWDDPPLKLYDPPLAAGTGDGFELNCAWDNTTGKTVSFGESAKTNEMCLLWAYYYPDTGADIRVGTQ